MNIFSSEATLRPLNAEHAALAAALHADATTNGIGDEAWSAEAFSALFASPGTFGFLAVTADEEPAGFVLARRIVDEAEILMLAVAASHRRRGLGRGLLHAALAAAREAGARRMLLEVAVDNAAARVLYASAGFIGVGRRRGYYRRPNRPAADSLVLSCAL